GSVLVNYAIIREVQERLYGLNYSIKVMNGQLSKETRDAISAWQQVVKRPVTGDFTQEDLDYLRAANPITVWGAIAFEARGAYGIVWSRTS
ncbi:peptidoglycan-binding domain-containing protein, partial [Salmonella enterica]|uniref:peptidoglycan-binding domain-containing protein n=1 Tax=Salmonella enterica TaxID=28901 RepID=UPI003D2C90A1